MSDQPMATVPKLTRGIQRCCRPQTPYSAQHVYIHTYLTPYRLYMNYRCYQITMQ